METRWNLRIERRRRESAGNLRFFYKNVPNIQVERFNLRLNVRYFYPLNGCGIKQF